MTGLGTNALLGAVFGIGLWVAWTARRRELVSSAPSGKLTTWWARHRPARPGRRAAIALAAGAAAVAVTGWPVLLPMVAGAVWRLPELLGPDRQSEEAIERMGAIASWTEQLRDTLAAASGLEQTLRVTAANTPDAIRAQVQAMARRLSGGDTPPQALRAMADELSDPIADLVVVALVGAYERQAGNLADLLGALARSTREQAMVRSRISTARARVRTGVRVVVGATLAVAGLLFLSDPGYLAPYGSALGQTVLAVVGGLFAFAFAWMGRIAAIPAEPRLLAPEPATPAIREAL